jgi:hypothetical protein
VHSILVKNCIHSSLLSNELVPTTRLTFSKGGAGRTNKNLHIYIYIYTLKNCDNSFVSQVVLGVHSGGCSGLCRVVHSLCQGCAGIVRGLCAEALR